MGPSPNAVLSDIRQIASGVDARVAVLSVLSNRKSRVCIPGRRHRRPLTSPAALKDSALPASVCEAEGPRSVLLTHCGVSCHHRPLRLPLPAEREGSPDGRDAASGAAAASATWRRARINRQCPKRIYTDELWNVLQRLAAKWDGASGGGELPRGACGTTCVGVPLDWTMT